jgi:hypothetical protein
MKTYRRRKDSDTWHWCKNCHLWPTSDYVEKTSSTRPSGDLCNHCKAKEGSGDCR